jgi:hypothetical protein
MILPITGASAGVAWRMVNGIARGMVTDTKRLFTCKIRNVISLPQLSKDPPRPGCGECTACCDVIGVLELGKPYYARCEHLNCGCGIYTSRPQQCAQYRCAWHAGMLGDRVDRRPDKTGVIFQYEPENGKWVLGIYEVVAGAADSDRTRYLRDMILTSKKTRHLPMASPVTRTFHYGANVSVSYPVSLAYQNRAKASVGSDVGTTKD